MKIASLLSWLQETLEYFANPDNLNTDALPPGLASWDPAPYLASAIPIATSIIGVNFMHEVGHRIAAFIRKVKLGPTYFVPNLQVGSHTNEILGISLQPAGVPSEADSCCHVQVYS